MTLIALSLLGAGCIGVDPGRTFETRVDSADPGDRCLDPGLLEREDWAHKACSAGAYLVERGAEGFDMQWLAQGWGGDVVAHQWAPSDGFIEISIAIETLGPQASIGYQGAVLLQVFDGTGKQVESRLLEANGSPMRLDGWLDGAQGMWTFQVDLVKFEGMGTLIVRDAERP